MSNITIIENPKCPYCKAGKVLEHDTAVVADTGCEITLDAVVKKVGIGDYDDFDNSWEAVYHWDDKAVGFVLDYSHDPNKNTECDIQDTVYRCSSCGKQFHRDTYIRKLFKQ